MTTDHFRECLDLIGWTQRGLAARLKMDERQVRRWAAGAEIPDNIATWLERLGRFHQQNPPPARAHRAAQLADM